MLVGQRANPPQRLIHETEQTLPQQLKLMATAKDPVPSFFYGSHTDSMALLTPIHMQAITAQLQQLLMSALYRTSRIPGPKTTA